jgi:proline iminopeptidase
MIQKITLNGCDFIYATAGEDDGQTIVILHGGRGLGDHRADFAAFLPLADRFRLLAYDQRGCGTTSLTPPYTFEQLADDLEAFRIALCGGRQIILIGGSFGGMIALTYAVRYPGSLAALILRGTAASHHHEAGAIANFKARLHKATSLSLRMVEKMFSDDVADDIELRLIFMAMQPLYFEKFDPDAALEATRNLSIHAETHNALFARKDYDVRHGLKYIAMPTLVVVGREDWICPAEESREIAAAIPKAELLEVEGANHPVHIEKNALVIGAIRDFLDRRLQR